MMLLTVRIPWDVEEYFQKHVKGGLDKNRKKFPNPSLGKFSDPLTVVDSKGRIVLWYLPGLLSEEHLVSNFFNLLYLISSYWFEPLLKKSRQKQSPDKTTPPNWRTHDVNFVTRSSTITIEPGSVNFSGGWLAQGHTVGFSNC